jgi:hypothetical protein
VLFGGRAVELGATPGGGGGLGAVEMRRAGIALGVTMKPSITMTVFGLHRTLSVTRCK